MPRIAPLRLAIARALESGAWTGPLADAAAGAWSVVAARTLARPLTWPESVRLVAVGGATLGGSGKTPLAIACTRALAASGVRVALVGHGYRARIRGAHVVEPRAPLASALAQWGDEAVLAARACAGLAPVVVGETRQAAVDLASTLADVLVVDGVLQTAPRRASLSLLALDGEARWGSGEVPPRGDLRAPVDALIGACDAIVPLFDPVACALPTSPVAHFARIESRGARASGASGVLVRWSELASLRVGLFVALARPARVARFLARRGVTPTYIHAEPDHARGRLAAPLAALLRSKEVDLWLATPKCALALEAAKVPHAVLDHALAPSPGLLAALQVPLTPLDSGRYSTFVRDLPRI